MSDRPSPSDRELLEGRDTEVMNADLSSACGSDRSSAPPSAIEAEHKAFAVWAKLNGYELDVEPDDGGYVFDSTGDAWEGWIGRAESGANTQPPANTSVGDSATRSEETHHVHG